MKLKDTTGAVATALEAYVTSDWLTGSHIKDSDPNDRGNVNISWNGGQFTKVLGPLNQAPASGDVVFPTISQLTWTNPLPVSSGTVTCDVYFRAGDENFVAGDKIVTGLAVETAPISGLTTQSTYFWRVDCFDSSPEVGTDPVISYTFSFATNNGNQAPVVYAGDDIYNWLLSHSLK